MNKRILFVDDDRNVLDGLRNRLRDRRKKWDMVFVDSGQAALDIIRKDPFDVVVSDMRMPIMDGATLLRHVREEKPAIVRLVLSGHADEGAMLRAMAIAHQFLPKPCQPGVLENVIERVCNLQALVNDEAVRHAVGRIEGLPSAPVVYSKLMAALADDHASVDEVARILRQDGALCVQILHVVNSAFFGLSRPIVKVEDAVLYLGLATVRQLALVAEVFQRAHIAPTVAGLSVERIQAHSVLAGSIAWSLFSDSSLKETAFLAALLHDIGKLLLAAELPDRVMEVTSEMRSAGGPMHVLEAKKFGLTHAEVGAYLLGLWQIPFPVVEAVANHHAPERVEQQGFDIPAAVYVADILANEQFGSVVDGAKGARIELDLAYLERFGVADKLAGWREIARERAEATQRMGTT